jgi:hypothetical protein
MLSRGVYRARLKSCSGSLRVRSARPRVLARPESDPVRTESGRHHNAPARASQRRAARRHAQRATANGQAPTPPADQNHAHAKSTAHSQPGPPATRPPATQRTGPTTSHRAGPDGRAQDRGPPRERGDRGRSTPPQSRGFGTGFVLESRPDSSRASNPACFAPWPRAGGTLRRAPGRTGPVVGRARERRGEDTNTGIAFPDSGRSSTIKSALPHRGCPFLPGVVGPAKLRPERPEPAVAPSAGDGLTHSKSCPFLPGVVGRAKLRPERPEPAVAPSAGDGLTTTAANVGWAVVSRVGNSEGPLPLVLVGFRLA